MAPGSLCSEKFSIIGYNSPYSYHINLPIALYPLKVLNAFRQLLTEQMVVLRIRQLEEFNDGYTNDDNSDCMTIHPDYSTVGSSNDMTYRLDSNMVTESNAMLVGHTHSFLKE